MTWAPGEMKKDRGTHSLDDDFCGRAKKFKASVCSLTEMDECKWCVCVREREQHSQHNVVSSSGGLGAGGDEAPISTWLYMNLACCFPKKCIKFCIMSVVSEL